MVNLIINADDYAYFESTSTAICNLIEKEKITATSCMVTSPAWSNDASALKLLQNKADIGLHLCFNKFKTLTSFSNFKSEEIKNISDLILLLCKGKIKISEIEAEIRAQIELFEKHFGKLPDFIDGHHHVQQFPLINFAVIKVLKQIGENIYLRTSTPKVSNLLSFQMTFGGEILKGLAKINKLKTNDDFAGLYDFKTTNLSNIVFEQQIKDLSGKNAIFMCHPGLENDKAEKEDSIYHARISEYKFLSSDRSLELMKKHNISLGRFLF